MTEEDIYLGRQPILDGERRLHAFELLFRSGTANRAIVVDDVAATSSVIVRTLSEFGIDTVLGNRPGFINCGASFLMSDAIELLPPDKVVLEILETTAGTEAILARCKALKTQGYQLALDDFRGVNELNRPLLPMVDIVKVDVLGMDPVQLQTVTRGLSGLRASLLAEKIESEEEFLRCKSLGYRFFQGYYFSRPEVITGKRLTPAQLALIKLLGLLQQDADVRQIEELFKHQPVLGVNLLRLANSAASGLRSPLRSITGAIVLIGRRQLQRWILLLMLAETSSGGKQPVLLHTAATRGKFMELVAGTWGEGAALADSAFITGVVSVMDVLLGMPMDKVVASLGMAPEVGDALLRREGTIGHLLSLAEALEGDDINLIGDFVAGTLEGGGDMVNQAQGQALAWADTVLQAT